MSRLHSELQRLYLVPPASHAGPQGDPTSDSGLIDAEGRVRAMVFELARPANWQALSKVWRGVQTELELPAPGIAVSGSDGFQLWFSLANPVSVPRAHAFLQALRLRYLPDIGIGRVALLPVNDPSVPGQARHAPRVPARQETTGDWSAFLSPDLAPVFDDTPWLDIPPGDQGQADLLSRLECIKPAAFDDAMQRLESAASRSEAAEPQAVPVASAIVRATAPGGAVDPRSFLLRVMNDESVALALRIEAAKALLPFADGGR